VIVELHCHTHHSKDSLMHPRRLLTICQERGIDRVAITDHNTIHGALEAAAIEPQRTIVGEEIMTSEGELLAYFVKERVPPRLSPEETISLLRAQGAVISIAHPFDSLRTGAWDLPQLMEILPLVDAIETFNARNWSRRANRRAALFALEAGLLATAGSDAHTYMEVGRARMRLPGFNSVESFRLALANAEFLARPSLPFVHLFSRYASFRKFLGWKSVEQSLSKHKGKPF